MPERLKYTAWEWAQIVAAEARAVKRSAALGSDAGPEADRRRAQIDAKARKRLRKTQ